MFGFCQITLDEKVSFCKKFMVEQEGARGGRLTNSISKLRTSNSV